MHYKSLPDVSSNTNVSWPQNNLCIYLLTPLVQSFQASKLWQKEFIRGKYWHTFETAYLDIHRVLRNGKSYKFLAFLAYSHHLFAMIQKLLIFTSEINWKSAITNSPNLISSNIFTATISHIMFIHQQGYFTLSLTALAWDCYFLTWGNAKKCK